LQDHLKERLTGAAILVAIVVLLVPEMFRGRPGGNTVRGTGVADGPPLRSYTIDLRDTPAAQPPAASVAAGSVSMSAAAPAAGAAAPVSAVVAAPVAAPAPKPSTDAAAVPATIPLPAARAAAGVSAWVVQVGSFARRDYAERMVKQVRTRGFAVEVAGPDDHGLYRVRSAPLADSAAAGALRQKMRARGLKPIVNKAP
jgi:DedD protein